jgi:hypothetical protein
MFPNIKLWCYNGEPSWEGHAQLHHFGKHKFLDFSFSLELTESIAIFYSVALGSTNEASSLKNIHAVGFGLESQKGEEFSFP